MTLNKISYRIFFLLVIFSSASRAETSVDLRSRWSNEFLPYNIGQESFTPFIWGIRYQGTSPRQDNPDRLFSLASVKKIITAATSLRELGSQFRFTNEFSASFDPVQKVVLNASFSVSGDPTWGLPSYGETLTTRISKVIEEFRKLGVKKVYGNISIHSLKPSVAQFERPVQWKKSWEMVCYAALPVPVTLNGNCAELVVAGPKKVYWNTPGVSTPVENQMKFSHFLTPMIRPEFDSLGRVKKYVLMGGFSKPFSLALPVHQNEDWLKNLFIQELKKNGMAYEQTGPQSAEVSSMGQGQISIQVDLSSVTLKEMLIPFLQDSINLVGERLHIEAPDDFGTLASLISDSREYEKVTLVDGSGLISENRMSPQTLFLFLDSLQNQPYFRDLFDGLPVSGVSGTLENRMKDPLLKNRIHAKTGTISGVSNLAGYWVKNDQTLEPFVIFTESGVSAQAARAKIDDQVAEFARKN